MEIKPIKDLVNFCNEEHVDIIIVCTSKEAAENLTDDIIRSGVKGIWNYSHFDFSVHDSTLIVENVHLRDNLMALAYRITHRSDE